MRPRHDCEPEEALDYLALQLRAERPQPSTLELDRVKRRVLAGAAHTRQTTPRTKGFLMRSRLALVSVIAVGALFSGTGATLALSGNLSASQAVEAQPQTGPQVLGQQQSGNPSTTGTPTNQTLPPTTTPATTNQAAGPSVQGAQQVAASGTQTLPFTGLAAIPILVIGLLMLLFGFVLNRRTRDQQS